MYHAAATFESDPRAFPDCFSSVVTGRSVVLKGGIT